MLHMFYFGVYCGYYTYIHAKTSQYLKVKGSFLSACKTAINENATLIGEQAIEYFSDDTLKLTIKRIKSEGFIA